MLSASLAAMFLFTFNGPAASPEPPSAQTVSTPDSVAEDVQCPSFQELRLQAVGRVDAIKPRVTLQEFLTTSGVTQSLNFWEEVPGGHFALCHNEVPTKINWHYLRWLFSTETRRSVELQINDRTMDLRDIPVPVYDETYYSCDRLLNFIFDVRTYLPVRNFLFLDSVVVSVDW